MRKNLIRVFSLLLCFCLLVCAAPRVSAESLERVRMPQMREMHFDTSGEIYFTEVSELVGLVQQVKSHPDVFFSCTYEGADTLVLPDGLTIPANLAVYCYTGTSGRVQIPEGAKVTVEGFLGASKLDVFGELNVPQSGGAAVVSAMQVTGKVQLDGFLNLLSGLGTNVDGITKIACGATGAVWVICAFADEAQLRQQVSAANNAPKNWKYDCYNAVASLNLTSPLVIPRNLYLSMDISEQGNSFTLTGSPITVNGEIDVYTGTKIQNDLMFEEDGYLYVQTANPADTLTLGGKVVCDGSMDIMSGTVFQKELFLGGNSWLHVTAKLTMEDKVTNYGVMDFYYNQGGVMTFSKPDKYDDGTGDETGVIYVNGPDAQIPASVFVGPNLNHFAVKHYSADVADVPCWRLTGYNYQQPTQPEGSKDVTPMYRLYNPNSGEHFYTGSTQERDVLKAAGWHYEGIAWNAPTKSGEPVYRLFNPNNGDHHYTMSTQERDMLVGVGWQYEGVAWNSASSSNVPMYRLFNPNADCGSHHYTGSTEERDYLVSLGWHYEGIGWYGIA